MPVRPIGLLAWLFLLVAAWPALAQNPLGQTGLLLTVPVPLKSGDVKRIVDRVNKAREAGANRPAIVAFEFNPGGQSATNADFGECYNLAKAIGGWSDLNTVAFVSRPTSGHLVLPVLCCNELVMSKDGKLGAIVDDRGEPLAAPEQETYRLLLQAKRPGQFAVVRKMFDRTVRLGKGTKENGSFFVDLKEKPPTGVTVSDTKPILDAGTVGLFDADRLQEFGLVKVKADITADLGRLYNINPSTFRDDPLAGRAPIAFSYKIADNVTEATRESVIRTIKKAVTQDRANLFILQLECDEGDMAAAAGLAGDLHGLQQPTEDGGVRIVAFIPNTANNTSVAIALGCSEILMSRRKDQGENAPEGRFADFEGYIRAGGQSADNVSKLLVEIAEKQNYPVLLVRGFVERELVIVQAQNRVNRSMTRMMTAEEAATAKDEWTVLKEIKPRGQLLKLTASEARDYGLVSRVIDRSDRDGVLLELGLDKDKVREATPGWVDQLRNFIQNPAVTTILVLVGFIGLILELKVPGTTVPGIVAALCFILVFWAWWVNNQAVAVLAGLLFLLGIVLILIEVFVLPGFGVTGVVGILLMLGALTLITVEKIPEHGSDWLKLGAKTAQYLFALIGAFIAAFIIAKYLPKVPVANRMVLAPQSEREALDPTILPGAAQAAALLGAIGVASTVLRPAGTVQFGEEFVDVVSDGEFITAGTRVQVVEVEGTRIVVKEV